MGWQLALQRCRFRFHLASRRPVIRRPASAPISTGRFVRTGVRLHVVAASLPPPLTFRSPDWRARCLPPFRSVEAGAWVLVPAGVSKMTITPHTGFPGLSPGYHPRTTWARKHLHGNDLGPIGHFVGMSSRRGSRRLRRFRRRSQPVRSRSSRSQPTLHGEAAAALLRGSSSDYHLRDGSRIRSPAGDQPTPDRAPVDLASRRSAPPIG